VEAENKKALDLVRRETQRDAMLEDFGKKIDSLGTIHAEYGRQIGQMREILASITGRTVNGIDYRPNREGD